MEWHMIGLIKQFNLNKNLSITRAVHIGCREKSTDMDF
jgi:hypothetical protein